MSEPLKRITCRTEYTIGFQLVQQASKHQKLVKKAPKYVSLFGGGVQFG